MEFDKKVIFDVDGFIETGKQFDLDLRLPEDNRNVIYGIVKDSITNKSIKNATISEVDNMSNSTESDINGIFSIKVKKGSKVIIIAPFYKDLSFIADSNCNIKAYLKEEPELVGEIPAPVENTP